MIWLKPHFWEGCFLIPSFCPVFRYTCQPSLLWGCCMCNMCPNIPHLPPPPRFRTYSRRKMLVLQMLTSLQCHCRGRLVTVLGQHPFLLVPPTSVIEDATGTVDIMCDSVDWRVTVRPIWLISGTWLNPEIWHVNVHKHPAQFPSLTHLPPVWNRHRVVKSVNCASFHQQPGRCLFHNIICASVESVELKPSQYLLFLRTPLVPGLENRAAGLMSSGRPLSECGCLDTV